ncbi:MAG: penicillin binding protein PBP4B [Burkholderiales bacterium]|nr:penicillin binding protein PBP4B [Burkholderiales bacterium]
MRKIFLAIIFNIAFNAFALTNCYDSSFVKGESVNPYFDMNKLSLVDKQIESDINNGFPSAELLIIKNHQIIKHSVYGYSQKYDNQNNLLKTPELASCDTLYDLASNTKMYATNYAIMHLVYLGKLDINKPVSYYIPSYTGCDKNGECRNKRTVRNLLSHTGGYMPDPQFFNPVSIQKYGNYYSQNRMLTESIIVTQLPFINKVGSKPIYSDVDFILLGMLVENITGLGLDYYVTQNIYKPLGLKSTFFNPLAHGVDIDKCAATEIQGNTRGGKVSFPNIRTDIIKCQVHDEKAFYSMAGVSGHAGLFSTANDLAILTELSVNNGCYNNICFWDKKTQKMFTSPLKQDSTYGLGWRRAGKNNDYAPFGKYASNLAYGHTGWIGTVTLIDPKHDLTIILLTNKKHSVYKNGEFAGDKFATGRYAPIIDLIYEAIK